MGVGGLGRPRSQLEQWGGLQNWQGYCSHSYVSLTVNYFDTMESGTLVVRKKPAQAHPPPSY